MPTKALLVVDCQYDFIDGTLACEGAKDAVRRIVTYINAHPEVSVHYSTDWHPLRHCSFIPNGGTWPIHCVAGSHGAELHQIFAREVLRLEQRPVKETIYRKGTNIKQEEYSAFAAFNTLGRTVAQDVGDDVIICGIASEFCVRESALALLKARRKVTIMADSLGWVDEANHRENLRDLAARGVIVQ